MLKHHNTVVWEINAIRVWLFGALAMLGEMDELNRRLPSLIRDARKRGDRLALDVFEASFCALAPLARDAPRDVFAAIERSGGQPERTFSSPSYHRLVGFVLGRFYEGNYRAAWNEIDRAWPNIIKARFLQLELLGVWLKYFRASAALGASDNDRALIDEARRIGKGIEHARVRVAHPLAAVIQAELDHRSGKAVAARASLTTALGAFVELGMSLFAHATQRRLAILSGADALQVRQIEDAMRARGVSNPPAFARALVLGN